MIRISLPLPDPCFRNWFWEMVRAIQAYCFSFIIARFDKLTSVGGDGQSEHAISIKKARSSNQSPQELMLQPSARYMRGGCACLLS